MKTCLRTSLRLTLIFGLLFAGSEQALAQRSAPRLLKSIAGALSHGGKVPEAAKSAKARRFQSAAGAGRKARGIGGKSGRRIYNDIELFDATRQFPDSSILDNLLRQDADRWHLELPDLDSPALDAFQNAQLLPIDPDDEFLRVCQVFVPDDPSRPFPVAGRHALFSEPTLGNRLVDGIRTDTTWVFPGTKEEFNSLARWMTGRPDYRGIVEFTVLRSELQRPGGAKWLFQKWQRTIPNRIDLSQRWRTPVYGELTPAGIPLPRPHVDIPQLLRRSLEAGSLGTAAATIKIVEARPRTYFPGGQVYDVVLRLAPHPTPRDSHRAEQVAGDSPAR